MKNESTWSNRINWTPFWRHFATNFAKIVSKSLAPGCCYREAMKDDFDTMRQLTDLARGSAPRSLTPGELTYLELTPRARPDKLYRARSRLYRNEILQVNMRLKALLEIYTTHYFALL